MSSSAFGWEPSPDAKPDYNGWQQPEPKIRSCLPWLLALLASVLLVFAVGFGLGFVIGRISRSDNDPPVVQNDPAANQKQGAGPGDVDFEESEDFKLEVDYDVPIKVRVQNYDRVEETILGNGVSNQPWEKGRKKQTFRFFEPLVQRNSREAVEHMNLRGFRPATLKELLTIAPFCQRKLCYVPAFGTSVEGAVPTLFLSEMEGRTLTVRPRQALWNSTRYLGVKKD
jgi:hypothetical protein